MCAVRRVCLAFSAAVLAAACVPAPALANGDPASDVLITDFVFLPYEAPSREQEDKLRRVVDSARTAGQTVRVAVIHSPRDLGAVTNLYGHPQEYANLLSRELQNPVEPGARGHSEELLVVMPAGYGTKNVPGGVERMLRGVDLASDASPDDLAAAAGWAVQELAKASGRPIREEFDKPAGEGGGGALVTVLVILGLVALVAALVVVRMRAGRTPAQSPGANT
jgi:hypothetical protein